MSIFSVLKLKIKNLKLRRKSRVFLDTASATPIRSEVLEVVRAYEDGNFALNSASGGVGQTFTNVNVLANPSALYLEARVAKEHLSLARKEVARALNTTSSQIIFTSGGTEANNIALLGVFKKVTSSATRPGGGRPPHIISSVTEHPAIREVLSEIERQGGEVTLITPRPDGIITAEQVLEALRPETILVSIMYVNNEIGVVQPIKEIAKKIREKRQEIRDMKGGGNAPYPYFHTDACQAPLWYNLDVSTLGVDLLTLDGLKVGGPIGVGCLYIKGGTDIAPVMYGGGQEGGLRSGTENVGGYLGFAKALTLAKGEKNEVGERVGKFRDQLWKKIKTAFPLVTVNGSLKHRAPNNLNVCFPGIDAEYLTVALDTYGVCVSYSSSCRTLKEDSTSYVIEALTPECKGSSIRFTLSRETTEADIDFAFEALKKAVIQMT